MTRKIYLRNAIIYIRVQIDELSQCKKGDARYKNIVDSLRHNIEFLGVVGLLGKKEGFLKMIVSSMIESIY